MTSRQPFEDRRSALEELGLFGPVAKCPRLSPSSHFAELVDAWLYQLGTTKPAANTVAAYRRDLEGVARRIAADAEVGVLHLDHLTKEALRAAFASWADDHAAASVLRAHSSWSSFFDFLMAEDPVEGNPMAAVGKPRRRPVLLGPSATPTPPFGCWPRRPSLIPAPAQTS